MYLRGTSSHGAYHLYRLTDCNALSLGRIEEGISGVSNQIERSIKTPPPTTNGSSIARFDHLRHRPLDPLQQILTISHSRLPWTTIFSSDSSLPLLSRVKKCLYYHAPAPCAPLSLTPNTNVAWEDVSSAHAPFVRETHHGKTCLWFLIFDFRSSPPSFSFPCSPTRGLASLTARGLI